MVWGMYSYTLPDIWPFIWRPWVYMGMADWAKTSEIARSRSQTAQAHPIFDICDLILRSNSLKFQILSPLLPLNLLLNFENFTTCPFKQKFRNDFSLSRDSRSIRITARHSHGFALKFSLLRLIKSWRHWSFVYLGIVFVLLDQLLETGASKINKRKLYLLKGLSVVKPKIDVI